MKIVEILKRMVWNSDKSIDLLEQTVAGVDNETRLLNQKFGELIVGLDNQSRLLNNKLTAIIDRQNVFLELQKAQIATIKRVLAGLDGSDSRTDASAALPAARLANSGAEKEQVGRRPAADALASLPLMIDARTYNTSHPDYDAQLVRNFPGKIFNADKPCANAVYASLKSLAVFGDVPDNAWAPILNDALEEAKTVPHSHQVFERHAYIENYVTKLARKYDAHYFAGWVNLDDALFLYSLVRKLKPTTIVQTGVCNGLSSAFMMLGLVKNGAEGKLCAIDLPPVFDPSDASWTIKDKVYGHVLPEGKSSGWMVPDAYRDRLDVRTGDARKLLPGLVDELDSIDLFYHDSDHTYDHMMFEFREAKRKLKPGGLIVADDVSWNASIWDFADKYGVPAYNFKGAVGVACF